MKISGQAAVVTGAGNGIGRSIALALAREGCSVAIVDVEQDRAEEVAEEAGALGVASKAFAIDISDAESVTSMAEEAWSLFDGIQLLFNNAGVSHAAVPIWKTTEQDFNWCFSVNVAGALHAIRAFVPKFIEAGKPARVVNTASEHSFGVPHLGGGLYTASKHAMLGLSDVLRRELPDHVGVSVLCPGLVSTTLWRASERRPDEFGGSAASDAGGSAFMQRGKTPEDIARQTVRAVERDEFLIVTHSHAIGLAEERWDEIRDAFERQAPRSPGDEKYDIRLMLRRG